MRVLVVGGGIAGCACAALLQKHKKFTVTLIEQAPKFENIGYVLALWGTGRKVLDRLGIDQSVHQNGYSFDRDIVHSKNGRLIKTVEFADFPVLESTVAIERSQLHRDLFELLTDTDIRFNTTGTDFAQTDQGVQVKLSDGTSETFDLVVGADGIHSSVREKVFGPQFLHKQDWKIWMWWLPKEHTAPQNPTTYYGSGRLCALLPFFNRAVVILVAKKRAQSKESVNTAEEIKSRFSDFCRATRDIVATAAKSSQIYQDDISFVEMPLWHQGRVVLVGDAQHAASPVTGMGASMALEDAAVLVEELLNNVVVEDALASFAKRRQRRIKRFRNMVHKMDRWTMAGGVLGHLRNLVLPVVPTWYFVHIVQKFVEDEEI